MANGRCHIHGGSSNGGGAPKGSKNALKTGEHESILVSSLEVDEQVLFDEISLDKKDLIEEELRLITIREKRMLDRISSFSRSESELHTVSVETSLTNNSNGRSDSESRRKELVSVSAMKIEEALTRVQAQKLKLIDQLHKMKVEDGGESPLDRLAKTIAGRRAEIETD